MVPIVITGLKTIKWIVLILAHGEKWLGTFFFIPILTNCRNVTPVICQWWYTGEHIYSCLYSGSILVLEGGEYLTPHSGYFTPREQPQYQGCSKIGGLRAGLDRYGEEKTTFPHQSLNPRPSSSCKLLDHLQYPTEKRKKNDYCMLGLSQDWIVPNQMLVLAHTENILAKFDIHGSTHRRWLSRNTNKMQLCNRIYYSKVYWRLNMFRAAHRSSSGALNCICSLWFIYTCGDRPLSRLSGKNFPTQPWQRLVTTWVYKPEAANTV